MVSSTAIQGVVVLEGRTMLEAFCGEWASQSSFAFTLDLKDLPAADHSTDMRVPAPPAKGVSQWLLNYMGGCAILSCPGYLCRQYGVVIDRGCCDL